MPLLGGVFLQGVEITKGEATSHEWGACEAETGATKERAALPFNDRTGHWPHGTDRPRRFIFVEVPDEAPRALVAFLLPVWPTHVRVR